MEKYRIEKCIREFDLKYGNKSIYIFNEIKFLAQNVEHIDEKKYKNIINYALIDNAFSEGRLSVLVAYTYFLQKKQGKIVYMWADKYLFPRIKYFLIWKSVKQYSKVLFFITIGYFIGRFK